MDSRFRWTFRGKDRRPEFGWGVRVPPVGTDSGRAPRDAVSFTTCVMMAPVVGDSLVSGKSGPEEISPPLLFAFAPLDKAALGLACAMVCGLLMFLATAFLIVTHHRGPLGPNLSLLGQFFLGYSVSWKGALIGLVWGGLLGYVAGWLFAFIRNFALALYLFMIKTRAEADQYRDFLDHI